jgi:mycothiol synthase
MGAVDRPTEVFGSLGLRPATVEEADAISELMNEMFVAEIGEPWTTPEEVRDVLTSPGRDPAFVNMVAVDADGTPVGYLEYEVTPEPLEVAVFPNVVPRLWGRGVNAWLLRFGEGRTGSYLASRLAGSQAIVRVGRFANNEPARRLFEALGYRYERTFWLMRIDLSDGSAEPTIPEGIELRTLDPERDVENAYDALAEAFADHWGGPFEPYDQWRHDHVDGEAAMFDPNLWFVAVDGNEIVGVASCTERSPRSEDTARVKELAVRRGWRRRGIAQALLRTAFREFARRGILRAELSVDAENTTGATRLYERVGMRVAYCWEFWRKDLVPGN